MEDEPSLYVNHRGQSTDNINLIKGHGALVSDLKPVFQSLSCSGAG